jgi:hypothetical protein
MILADEKLMEKYGNIGDKSALRRFAELPINMGKTLVDTTLDTLDQRQKALDTL